MIEESSGKPAAKLAPAVALLVEGAIVHGGHRGRVPARRRGP